ncbi:response regulator transcription factor [Lysobacter niastensis]|uniref:Response regulator transcription factor n=1 Tax=Lysobacter niastensis TaxID=380629 RepID=A0ABS0B806_9GAMM|nr:response regulator [Lysobacter niastensis]MBF6023832.1 response regulator transcription factor [Lysobacter niastensis]
MNEEPVVYIVDDDPEVLKALGRLFASCGIQARTSLSPEDFLRAYDAEAPGCLVLDIAMPDMNGLEFQRCLAEKGAPIPVVFLTGSGDIPSSVRAMKDGAVDFLTKPVDAAALMAAVEKGLDLDRVHRERAGEREGLDNLVAQLTAREKEVMTHLLAGRMNKQIAGDLGVAEKTVKVHRSRVMHKLHVRSVAELVRLAERAGLLHDTR